MEHSRLEALFPAFTEISDKELKARAEETMAAAMRKGGWDECTIHACPVTLNWKNCGVTWVEHVTDVTAMCIYGFDAMKKYYDRHGAVFRRDLVVAGALLHDIGKLTEFAYRDGKAVHSGNFQLLRHPLSGAVIAAGAGCPDELVHLIAVHSFEGDRSYQTAESEFVRSMDILVFNCSVKGLEKINA